MAPVVPEFKRLGSVISQSFEDSVAIMARIRLARIALSKLQTAISGTRQVSLESKKIAYVSRILLVQTAGANPSVDLASTISDSDRPSGIGPTRMHGIEP